MANPNQKLAAEKALYLYGISRDAGKRPAKISHRGIDDLHQVRSLACGGYLCWVSEVDHTGFVQAVERNMENLEWLALHGIRHQQVVGEVAAQVALVPARFGTVFSGEPALTANVLGKRPALEKVFARITGADEWGVKVFAEAQPAAPAPADEPPSGKAYLQQKAARLKKRPEHGDQEIQELAKALKMIATGVAPSGKVSGAQPHLLWQATFLVPRKQRKAWDAALKEFVRKWDGVRRIEVNGPWPPYSFVSDAD